MRNDYGTRWTPPRFKSGGSVSKGKKQGYNDRLDESLGARRGKNLKALKLEEMSLKVWKKHLAKELILLLKQWINNEIY